MRTARVVRLSGADGQRVRARAALARAEAAESIAVVHDEARAAHAALRHAGEQVRRTDELPETLARLGRLPLLLHGRVARLVACHRSSSTTRSAGTWLMTHSDSGFGLDTRLPVSGSFR
jgi:hypothetical protein